MAVHWGGVAGMVVFYLVILGIGLWASRKTKGGKTSETVMVARRDFGWFVGLFTLIATWVGGGYINGTAEVMATNGLGLVWAQAPWGYSISFIINGIFFAEKMRARNYVTMIDPFQVRYGDRMGGVLFLAALMGELLWCAAILAALGSTISVILELNQTVSVIVSACIAALYTFFGGLYSVAYTDIIQLIFMFLGLWLAVPFAITNPSVEPLRNTTSEWVGEFDPRYVGVWLDSALLLIFGGVPWQAYYQRALAAKTPRHAKYLSIAAAFGCFLLSIPAYLMGAIGASTDWASTNINLNKTDPIEDPSIILPAVIQFLTPPAVAFLGLGAVSAAVMSSTDSSVLSSSSMFVRNIYRNIFRPKASETELLWAMRCSVVVVAALATIMALTVHSIYSLFVLCSDFVYVILFPQLVCVVHVAKANTYGAAIAFVVGLLLRLGGGEPVLKLPAFIRYPFYDVESGTQLFPFRTLIMIVSLVITLVVSYTTSVVFERGYLDKRWDVLSCFDDDKGTEAEPGKYSSVKYELEPLGDDDSDHDADNKKTTADYSHIE